MNADRLRHLNDRLLTCGNDYSDVLLDGAAEIERLRAERDKVMQFFLTHGRHHKDCSNMNSPVSVGGCDCGFDAALTEVGGGKRADCPDGKEGE